jgi:hypothetical protein
MRQVLARPTALETSALYRFLVDCLGRQSAVQAAVLPVLAALYAEDVLSALSPDQRDSLKQGVRRLADSDSLLVRRGVEELHDLLES